MDHYAIEHDVIRTPLVISIPRPLTERDVNRLGWKSTSHDWRFAVNPDITGLSQLLAGQESRSSRRLDRLYLRRQSVLLDMQLIALSFAVNVVGKRKCSDG
jgi:lipopolysaccharide/colanic/teichoic acid biosynthesis glycosyltransferase